LALELLTAAWGLYSFSSLLRSTVAAKNCTVEKVD
jgi:hypothetical protein